MMRRVLTILVVCTLFLNPNAFINTYADNFADEQIVWQRKPIDVALPVGKERFITFPSKVQFGYNIKRLPSSALRVENDNRTIYLLAKKPFLTERTEAKLKNGTIVLMDIHAEKNAPNRPIDILLPLSNPSNKNSALRTADINYVSLMRYAVQQLYAPKRLLRKTYRITRFPMNTEHTVPLFYDGSASAMPLACWQGGGLFITAVLIKNLMNQPLQLDARALCGNWQAAGFFPKNNLAPHGTPINQDISTLFVISNKPFYQAVQECLTDVTQRTEF